MSTTNNKAVYTRIDDRLAQALDMISQRDDLTVSQIVRAALRAYPPVKEGLDAIAPSPLPNIRKEEVAAG